MSWHEKLGGRKFILSSAGLIMGTAMSFAGASSEAYIMIGTVVLSYCGGNAAIEWKHAGTSQGYRSKTSEPTS